MSATRAPWFKCFPTKLLGALAGMDPDEGHLYVTILLRIYENGGPIKDSAKILSRRCNMTERRASVALASLVESCRVSILDGGLIDSDTTHEYLSEREETLNHAKNAGKASVEKREEKNKEIQQIEATFVENSVNATPTIKKKKKEIDISLREINKTPLSVLTDCLGPEMAEAVIDHRRVLKKPISTKAAELMVSSLVAWGNPQQAASVMIERGWQSFKPEWMGSTVSRSSGAPLLRLAASNQPEDPNDPIIYKHCGVGVRLSHCRKGLARWKENWRDWDHTLGPEPDLASCAIPESVLAEFGLTKVRRVSDDDEAVA